MFEKFLKKKGISNEDFEAKTKEEQLALVKEHGSELAAQIEKIEKDVDSKIGVEEVKKMHDDLQVNMKRHIDAIEAVNSEQGVALKKLTDELVGAKKLTETEVGQIHKFIADNADEIKKIAAQGQGFVEIATKDFTLSDVSNPDGIPDLAAVNMANPVAPNMKRTIIDGLVSTFSTTRATWPYFEGIPGAGDVQYVLEKGLKPEIDFTMQARFAEPFKAAAHEILSTESVQDIPGMQSMATGYLRDKHDLRREKGILNGTGLLGAPEGALTLARLFVAGAMALKVDTPNFMDIVNAVVTDIFTTHNFVDEDPYMANLVLINPIDYFIEIQAAKDGNGLPLFPMASLFNRVVMGSTLVIPTENVTAGEIFVADMTKYRVSNYIPYTVKIGFINDQFITNQFTMVGESRHHAFVKELDKTAFVKDSIATIRTAIATL